MSEVLGHDVEGRPLNAGDKAIFLWAITPDNVVNELVTVTGSEFAYGYHLIQYDGLMLVIGDQLQKVALDRSPCEESFSELMFIFDGELA